MLDHRRKWFANIPRELIKKVLRRNKVNKIAEGNLKSESKVSAIKCT